MANQPQDREDLLREATALVERAEFTVTGSDQPMVIGFRHDGSASVFLGADPVFQFNPQDELRRAYSHGFLFKAEHGRLVRLERNRTAEAVELLRHALSDDEHELFLGELVEQMTDLRDRVVQGSYELVGTVPATVDVMARIQRWLNQLTLPPAIAVSPRLN